MYQFVYRYSPAVAEANFSLEGAKSKDNIKSEINLKIITKQ